ncbi:hypothetical protein LCGC14_2181260 [marine sediment metagenome]|uniref:Uncharacterized protein n=1 Tax=marine sediment metagenome TaxID=412755 RepID=A0A0F9FZS3_9ZZZZ
MTNYVCHVFEDKKVEKINASDVIGKNFNRSKTAFIGKIAINPSSEKKLWLVTTDKVIDIAIPIETYSHTDFLIIKWVDINITIKD